MAVQVNPITQSLPATTSIQDPAVRRFAQAVQDAISAMRSEAGAVESLKKAADAMRGAVSGGTPPSIAQWLFSSELYQKLTSEIARVDVQAKQDLLEEALARQAAIDEINATLATIQSTPPYDPLEPYPVGAMVTYEGKLYQSILETTGNLPTNTTYWKKIGDYASLGDVVAGHTLDIADLDSRVTANQGSLTAEISSRQALAAQVRGSYTGTDINQVSQGLIYAERVARATADSNEVAARQSLSAKLTGSNDPSGLTLSTLSSGLIYDEKQARASADGANASAISSLRAQVGVTEAGALTTGLLLDEKNVRTSNDLAIVSAVNTALAQITGVSTSISQSGQNLIANWTQAQATKWSQIESEVLTSGGKTIRAALQQEATTRANADGSLGAQWTLKTDINGYIAGFGFASTANNATPTSEFIIRADKFAVVMPGYGEHVPFAIGSSGAEFTGLTKWANVQDKPTNAQLLNNLLDPSKWYNGAWGTTLSGFGFNMNGGHWENYCTVGDLPDGSRGTVWQAVAGRYIGETRTPTPVAAGDADGGWNTDSFPIDPLKPYRFSVWVKRVSGSATIYSGVGASTVRNMGADTTTPNTNPYFWSGTTLSTGKWYLLVGYVYPYNYGTGAQTSRGGVYDGATGEKISNSTDYVWLNSSIKTSIQRVYQYYASNQAQTQFAWPRVDEINGSEPSLDQLLAMGVVSARNPITTSNVTTYIDNAAIGNAQIGGDLWSTNHVAGSSGWRIYRNGNAEFRNITARGDIEASALKAGTAMVDSLNLKGTALIIPMYINAGAASWNLPYVQGTWQYKEMLKFSFTVSATGTVRIDFGPYFTINHWQGHANYPDTITKRLEILRNGSVIETVATATSSGYITDKFIGTRWYTLSPGTYTFVVKGSAIMADGGPRFARSAAPSTVQSYTYSTSEV